MLPIPQHRNYWLLILGICLLASGLIAVISSRTATPVAQITPSPDEAVAMPVLPPAVSEEKSRPLSAKQVMKTQALARAIAAVGQRLDGHDIDLSQLDEQAAKHLEYAQVLLAGVPRQSAPGLPMRLPDGSVMRMGPDKKDNAPEPPVSTKPVQDTSARVVDGHLIPRRLDKSGRVPIPILGDINKDLVEPDAWIAIPYDPALVAGVPLKIVNRSGGKYAVSLQAEDYSTVRLNGGMIVPGRFYHMDDTTVISGDIPVQVTIRPLGVLHGFYEKPIRPPQANG